MIACLKVSRPFIQWIWPCGRFFLFLVKLFLFMSHRYWFHYFFWFFFFFLYLWRPLKPCDGWLDKKIRVEKRWAKYIILDLDRILSTLLRLAGIFSRCPVYGFFSYMQIRGLRIFRIHADSSTVIKRARALNLNQNERILRPQICWFLLHYIS